MSIIFSLRKRDRSPHISSRAVKILYLGLALSLTHIPAFAGHHEFDEEITVVGNRAEAGNVAGSAHFIGQEELEKFFYPDIQRIGREVPGVSIQLEDGYGLRPNISIRGVATERSGRITLLEDNVLIAPAPYSAPSAYYFPTAGRMSAFEVLKGPAAIHPGPIHHRRCVEHDLDNPFRKRCKA